MFLKFKYIEFSLVSSWKSKGHVKLASFLSEQKVQFTLLFEIFNSISVLEQIDERLLNLSLFCDISFDNSPFIENELLFCEIWLTTKLIILFALFKEKSDYFLVSIFLLNSISLILLFIILLLWVVLSSSILLIV